MLTRGIHPSSLPLHLIFSTLLPQSIDPAHLFCLAGPPAPAGALARPACSARPSSTTGEGGPDSGRPPGPCSDWPPHGQFCPAAAAAAVDLSRRRRCRRDEASARECGRFLLAREEEDGDRARGRWGHGDSEHIALAIFG
jgi:hypothetical protein